LQFCNHKLITLNIFSVINYLQVALSQRKIESTQLNAKIDSVKTKLSSFATAEHTEQLWAQLQEIENQLSSLLDQNSDAHVSLTSIQAATISQARV
jgi:hypothetical protein